MYLGDPMKAQLMVRTKVAEQNMVRIVLIFLNNLHQSRAGWDDQKIS